MTERYTFDWDELQKNVQNYIKSMNFGYKKELKTKNVQYINSFASFLNQDTMIFSN